MTAHRLWSTLRAPALLGTERRGWRGSEGTALGAWLNALEQQAIARTPEQVLLDAIAATSTVARCGASPAPGPPRSVVSPPPDNRPGLSARSRGHLQALLHDDRRSPLIGEWLDAASRAGRKVPAASLPALLEAGRKDTTLRPTLPQVLGPRGLWVAEQNPAWAFACKAAHGTADDHAWQQGSLAERVAWLRDLRAKEPARALACLKEAFAREHARERAALLETLEISLSDSDEPFLESSLDDRSKEVRRIASALLACVPGSRLVARMQARADPMLQLVQGASGAGAVQAEPPRAIGAAELRDGVVEVPPRKRGKRAWWFEQILSVVPPSHWSDTWGVSPQEALLAASRGEWGEALLAAWAKAAARHRDAAWAEALLELRPSGEIDLWKALAAPRKEVVAARGLLAARKSGEGFPQAIGRLRWVPGPWSSRFSRSVALALRALAARDDVYGTPAVYGAMRDAAHRMSPDAELEIRAVLAEAASDSTWSRALRELLDTLHFRASMLQELAPLRDVP